MMSSPDESKLIVDELKFFDNGFIYAETLNAWDDNILSILSELSTNTISAVPLLKSYIKSLKIQLNKNKSRTSWEILTEIILKHLQLLKIKSRNVNNAMKCFEDILAIYAGLELNIVADIYKNMNVKSIKTSKQLETFSRKILATFQEALQWKDLNVVHCLLKLKYDRKSPACVQLMKIMYHEVLFNKTIMETDDLTLCAFYLLFCNYKRLIPTEEHKDSMQIFLRKFNKDDSFLNDFPLLREILGLNHKHHDLNFSNGKIHIVNNYFKYIKHKYNSLFDNNNTSQHESDFKNTVKTVTSDEDSDFNYIDRKIKTDNHNSNEECSLSQGEIIITKSTYSTSIKSPKESYERNKRTRYKSHSTSANDVRTISYERYGSNTLRYESNTLSYHESNTLSHPECNTLSHPESNTLSYPEEKTIFICVPTEEMLDSKKIKSDYDNTIENIQQNKIENIQQNLPPEDEILEKPQIENYSEVMELKEDENRNKENENDLKLENINVDDEEIETLQNSDILEIDNNYDILEAREEVIGETEEMISSIELINIKSDHDDDEEIETNVCSNIEEDIEEQEYEENINGIPVSVGGETMYVLEVETSDNEKESISQDCIEYENTNNPPENAATDSNVIISQLQEYLSISNETQTDISENAPLERTNCDRSEETTNTKDITIEQIETETTNSSNNYVSSEQEDDSNNCIYLVDRLQTQESEVLQKNLSFHNLISSYSEDNTIKSWETQSVISQDNINYNLQFGYETPPKDGNTEEDFQIRPASIESMVVVDDNGFLTPENDIVNNIPLIPQEFQTEPICLSTFDSGINTFVVQTSDHQQIQQFNSQLKNNSFDYSKTLDLSMDHSKIIYNGTKNGKRHKAITLNGNVIVKKFHCNDKIMGRLTMPPLNDVSENEVTSTTKKNTTVTKSLNRQKRLANLCLDMDIESAFAQLNQRETSIDINKPITKPSSKTTELNDPKLYQMEPVVDLSQFASPYSKRKQRFARGCLHSKRNTVCRRIDVPSPIPKETKTDSESIEVINNKTSKDNVKSNYTDDEINLMLQELKSGTETRLPFKKRRMTLPEKEVTSEISYPATPMVSIAELEAIQSRQNMLTLPVSTSPVLPSEVPSYIPEVSGINQDINYNVNIYPSFAYDAYFDMNSQHAFSYNVNHFELKDSDSHFEVKDSFLNGKYVHVQSHE